MSRRGTRTDDFSELLERSKGGDREAAARLWGAHARKVSGLLARRLPAALRRHVDTADLVQSVFAEFLADLPRVEDRGPRAFRHWLYVRAEAKVVAKFRKHLGRRGERRIPTAPTRALEQAVAPGPSVLSGLERDAMVDRLRADVRALCPADREMLLMRHGDSLPYAEIAERLGLGSAAAARVRHARALLRLRQLWNR